MNKASNSTPAAPSAIDWPTVIDGRDGLYDKATKLRHMLHFLDADLEFAFDPARGRPHSPEGAGIAFTFQRDGIDATKWLAGSAWLIAGELVELIEGLQHQIDAMGGAS